MYIFLTVYLSSLACSSGFNYKVTTHHDQFEDVTIIQMRNNLLAGWNMISDANSVYLNAIKYEKENEVRYSFLVEYRGSNWLFIGEGETLILLIDGESIAVNGRGSSHHREIGSGPTISERAYYDLPLDLFIKMARAKEIKVKIKGLSYYIERHFSQINLNRWKKFFLDHVGRASDILTTVTIQ